MKLVFCAVATCVLAPTALFAQKNLSLDTLPQAVQSSIKKEVGNLPISSISKDAEGGKVEYEVETTYNGKPRSYAFDTKGKLLEAEDAVELDSIPAAAKESLQKKAAGGSISEVEKVTSGSKISYEADITTGAGKKIEVAVTPSGAVKSVENGDND